MRGRPRTKVRPLYVVMQTYCLDAKRPWVEVRSIRRVVRIGETLRCASFVSGGRFVRGGHVGATVFLSKKAADKARIARIKAYLKAAASAPRWRTYDVVGLCRKLLQEHRENG